MNLIKPILLIGYGNVLRSDDGVGWFVADKLDKKLHNKIDIIKADQITVEMTEDIKDRKFVIFVDAHVSEKEDWLRKEEVLPDFKFGMTAHIFTPGALLALCERIYNKYPKAYIFSIKGINYDFGENLSEQTKKAAEIAIKQIVDLVDQLVL
ncbi:MAG: hydrogenase maturation protease [bacterium]